jgi:hypothetical protein
LNEHRICYRIDAAQHCGLLLLHAATQLLLLAPDTRTVSGRDIALHTYSTRLTTDMVRYRFRIQLNDIPAGQSFAQQHGAKHRQACDQEMVPAQVRPKR